MFRFTIRDLLWLMVVAGAAACWYREQAARVKQNTEVTRWEKEKEAAFAAREEVLVEREEILVEDEMRLIQGILRKSRARLDSTPQWPDEAAPGVYFLK